MYFEGPADINYTIKYIHCSPIKVYVCLPYACFRALNTIEETVIQIHLGFIGLLMYLACRHSQSDLGPPLYILVCLPTEVQ